MRRVLAMLSVIGVATGILGLGLVGSAGADPPVDEQAEVVWTGNGTTDGVCDTVGEYDDLDPAEGEQGWLFVLTNPFGAGPFTLDVTFGDGATLSSGPETVKDPPGSVHFAVYSTGGEPPTVVAASSPNGTKQTPPGSVLSVLTVSHCEVGPTPPPEPPEPPDVAPADAVQVRPAFTG